MPYVPVDAACPTCKATAWGLSVDGGPMFDLPTVWTARCWPAGHERPVRKLEQR